MEIEEQEKKIEELRAEYHRLTDLQETLKLQLKKTESARNTVMSAIGNENAGLLRLKNRD